MIFTKTERGNTVRNDTYSEPVVIKVNNVTAKVYSPILTEEERNKRIEQIKSAVIRLSSSK